MTRAATPRRGDQQGHRYGLFIHYGLYTLHERAEWVWNCEEIPLEEYKQLVARFTAKQFDADRLYRMAVDAGMRYVVLTTMHHEGIRLYPTELSDFRIGNSGAATRCDRVAKTIAALHSCIHELVDSLQSNRHPH